MGDLNKMQYILIPRELVQSNQLNLTDKAVYTILKSFQNGNSQRCFPSHRKISEKSNISISTVRRSIKVLTENGFINTKSKKFSSSNYFFTPFKYQIQVEVSSFTNISIRALGLYLILLCYRDTSNYCRLNIRELCNVAKISYTNPTAKKLLQELVDNNLIIIEYYRNGTMFYVPYTEMPKPKKVNKKNSRNREYVEDKNSSIISI